MWPVRGRDVVVVGASSRYLYPDLLHRYSVHFHVSSGWTHSRHIPKREKGTDSPAVILFAGFLAWEAANVLNFQYFLSSYLHTYTHTHIYIYIYICLCSQEHKNPGRRLDTVYTGKSSPSCPRRMTSLITAEPNGRETEAIANSTQEGLPQLQQLDSATIEHLGRKRPSHFSNAWSECAFCFSIFMCQILSVSPSRHTVWPIYRWEGFLFSLMMPLQEYFISGSNVLLPTLMVELDIPSALSIWPSTALSLAVTSTLLIFGRLADMFGGFVLYVGGMAWLTVTSLIAGFSQNYIMLFVFRALQGLGLAAFLPSSIMILGAMYRPGPRKNMVFSIYGACAALGFFVGIFFSGLCGSFLTWSWYFFIGAILSAITVVSSYFSIPSDYTEAKKLSKATMDWIGSVLLVPGVVLVIFAIAASSHAPRQWKTPYIYVCLVVGVLFLGALTYMEGWVVKNPLLPGDLFAVKHMKPLVVALLCMYGSLGIFLLYAAL